MEGERTVGRVETAGVVEEAQKDEREEDKGWRVEETGVEGGWDEDREKERETRYEKGGWWVRKKGRREKRKRRKKREREREKGGEEEAKGVKDRRRRN